MGLRPTNLNGGLLHVSNRVLITGGAGFIGSKLARRLIDEGFGVAVLDTLSEQVHGADPDQDSATFHLLDPRVDFIRGSVTSDDDLARSLEGVDLVVHLAAETGTGQSMYEIRRYVDVNIGGTATLLEHLARDDNSVSRVVVSSSRSVYGEGAYRTSSGELVYPDSRSQAAMDAGDFEVHVDARDALTLVPTREDAMVHPSSVYGITKLAQEQLVLTSCGALGIEAVALRYQNVYGPGQSLRNPYTGILSIFSTLIRAGEEINVFEDGNESRDFVFIDDVVEATFRAATLQGVAGEVINVGSGIATTVTEVIERLAACYAAPVRSRVSGNYRLGDIRHNLASISKMADLLGFVPQVLFETGVAEFAAWVEGEQIDLALYQHSLDEMAKRRLLK